MQHWRTTIKSDTAVPTAPRVPAWKFEVRVERPVALEIQQHLNQAKLDPKKRLATQDVRDGPLNKAGFQDPSGSIGKGKGVFAFSDKYGGNIDSYAPIYNPQTFGDDLITGMSEQQFVIFMAILAPVFLSLPLAIALKGYGII